MRLATWILGQPAHRLRVLRALGPSSPAGKAIVLAAAAAWLGLPWPALGADKLACSVAQDSWAVTGSVGRKASCTVVCLLNDGRGDVDRVTCAFNTSGAAATLPHCEGAQANRRWTSASVLSQQCAYDD
jgi:hypothetical protein